MMGNVNIVTPIVALVGSNNGMPPAGVAVMGRTLNPRLREELRSIGLDTPLALFGGFIGGPEALRAFTGDGPLNTDDRPLVLFEAPRTVYEGLGDPGERLLALVKAMPRAGHDAVQIAGIRNAKSVLERLERYWQARDAFIALGLRTRLTGNIGTDARMLAPELLQILRLSPDFEPAYTPLLSIASRLSQENRKAAVELLSVLDRVVPARDDASRLRTQILGSG